MQQGQRSALERQTDWSKPLLGGFFQLCPTCAPSSAPTPEAELLFQDTTLGLPVAARGCPPCFKLSLHSDTHPKSLAQVLPPTSPPAFPASRSPIAPRCAGGPYLRAQPQGTAIAGAEPEVAVLRLLQAASPGRGGSGSAGGAVPAAELLRVAGPLANRKSWLQQGTNSFSQPSLTAVSSYIGARTNRGMGSKERFMATALCPKAE